MQYPQGMYYNGYASNPSGAENYYSRSRRDPYSKITNQFGMRYFGKDLTNLEGSVDFEAQGKRSKMAEEGSQGPNYFIKPQKANYSSLNHQPNQRSIQASYATTNNHQSHQTHGEGSNQGESNIIFQKSALEILSQKGDSSHQDNLFMSCFDSLQPRHNTRHGMADKGGHRYLSRPKIKPKSFSNMDYLRELQRHQRGGQQRRKLDSHRGLAGSNDRNSMALEMNENQRVRNRRRMNSIQGIIDYKRLVSRERSADYSHRDGSRRRVVSKSPVAVNAGLGRSYEPRQQVFFDNLAGRRGSQAHNNGGHPGQERLRGVVDRAQNYQSRPRKKFEIAPLEINRISDSHKIGGLLLKSSRNMVEGMHGGVGGKKQRNRSQNCLLRSREEGLLDSGRMVEEGSSGGIMQQEDAVEGGLRALKKLKSKLSGGNFQPLSTHVGNGGLGDLDRGRELERFKGRISCGEMVYEQYQVRESDPGFTFISNRKIYLANVWKRMLRDRKKNKPTSNYFNNGSQLELTATMRGILIDWLVDVHKKFKLRMQTLFMSVNIIDRVLEKISVAKHRFQLLGITALFIASKYEEIYPPYLSDFVFVCADAYNQQDILLMEAKIMEVLNFNLVFTSAFNLISAYSEEKSLSEKEYFILLYIHHLAMLELDFLLKDTSLLVAASIFLSKKILKRGLDLKLIQKEFDVDARKVKPLAKQLAFMLSGTDKCQLTACKRKFKQERFMSVSKIKVSVKDSSST